MIQQRVLEVECIGFLPEGTDPTRFTPNHGEKPSMECPHCGGSRLADGWAYLYLHVPGLERLWICEACYRGIFGITDEGAVLVGLADAPLVKCPLNS